MDKKLESFIALADLFNKNGFSLYLVGGSVRDFLLGIPLTDMDVVTDATPINEKKFLNDANYTFERFGSVKCKFNDIKFDITTLRKEGEYLDSRHPKKIEFSNKLEDDVIRRDITINALYLTKDLKVVDLVNGVNDLNNKIIRVVGDPNKRLKEDPLRIVRILRFKVDLGFDIDLDTYKAMQNNAYLLKLLNIDKVNEEKRKCHHVEQLLIELDALNK